MKGKILATPRSFAKDDDRPLRMLEDAGYAVVRNPVGQILTKEQMTEHLQGCVGVILGVDPMDADVIASAEGLRVISKYGVGTDNIDMEAAQSRGITVCVTAGANTDAVADYAFALMMAAARRVIPIDRACHNRDWSKQSALDVYGARLGIIGFGAIGRGVAARGAAGFNMRVLAHDTVWDAPFAAKYGVTRATPDEIYKTCDFISLHLPLTDKTRGMVSHRQFEMMKPTAVLVNTARGGVVDETALVDALRRKLIYGAGLDVFEQEPPELEPLYGLDNLVMGSHTAASTTGATRNMGIMAAQNIIQTLEDNAL